MRAAALAMAVLVAASALGASRGRFGGSLSVALALKQNELDPLWADTPSEAALLGLLARSICRVDRARGVQNVLAAELSRPSPTMVRVVLRPNLRFDDAAAVTAREVAASWSRVAEPGAASPYRALLYPLRGEGRQLLSAVKSESTLELPLSFPWPDLERGLCHPALSIADTRSGRLRGVGPFRATAEKGVFKANPLFPEGRPYADSLTVTATDERGAARLLSLKRAHVALGGADDGSASGAPALYSTYLGFRKAKVGPEFRAAFESAIDRADLTKYFVRAPAVPMSRLLPPALEPAADAPRPPAPGPRPGPAREVTLAYDQALDDQRAVAERLQVKLHERGYKVALKGLSRRELRAAWHAGSFDLLLHSLLLPPAPGPALSIVIEAAGRRDLLRVHLPALGAIPDAAARDAKARELAGTLAPELEILPLYAQALRVTVAPHLVGLTLDAQGLPALDGAFLAED